MNNENQIPLPLDGFEFRAGFDHPTLVTISPERLALALASARPAYRDAFVSALDAALGGDAVQRLMEERDEANATIQRLQPSGPSCDRCQSAHCCSVRSDAVPPLCVTDPEGSLPLWMPWTNEDVRKRVEAAERDVQRLRSSPAPVGGGVPPVMKREELLHLIKDQPSSDEVDYAASTKNVNDWIARKWDAYRLPALKPGEVDPTHPVFAFLLGEGPLQGFWFGDKPESERGAFWWRKTLRQVVRAQATTNEGGAA